MVVLQHEHSLSFIDLNANYPLDEEVYDDEEDLIIQQAFRCSCARCEKEITYLHRYYYKCDQCDYSLHKLCEHIPTKLQHASHGAHSLTLILDESQGRCRICKSTPRQKQLRYHCSRCMFYICLDCAMDEVQYHTIYHPSHQHPLIPTCRQRQIMAECDACGKKHEGVFYECSTCHLFLIHSDCLFQPKRLLIQDDTYGRFSHTHPLILTYSFSEVHQKAKNNPTCRVCDESFSDNENLWVYKCEKCRYYAHADCATSVCKPSNSNSDWYYTHPGVTIDEFRRLYSVVDFPLPDLSYDIFTNRFSKETNYEMNITHNSHEHPLILVESRSSDTTKVKDLCDVCDLRIMDITKAFYKCANGCNFVLHEWCTRLPAALKGHRDRDFFGDHIFKPHTLILFPKTPRGFLCIYCFKDFYGFGYSCVECGYFKLDVWCALTPTFITHKSHPYHLLAKLCDRRPEKDYCRVCLSGFTHREDFSFSCILCNFHLHPGCALLLPETTRHKYDKHPMTISYRPVENYEGDYFCEVCEEELNPIASFYHCQECVQSMHIDCVLLNMHDISKPPIQGLHVRGIRETQNVEFLTRISKEFAKLTATNPSQIPSSSRVPRGSRLSL